MPDFEDPQKLPENANALNGPHDVAKLLAERFIEGRPAVLLRYGDTVGRTLARPQFGTPQYAYLQRFLGATVTPQQVEWLASRIEESVGVADVVGLRSDLLGPVMPSDLPYAPDEELLSRLLSLYPIREVERKSLAADGARRLVQTRKFMEGLRLPRGAMLTDAWIHVGLAEIGLISALMREATTISIVAASTSRAVLKRLASGLPGTLRVFECPAYPWLERQWGGDHHYLWDRWTSLADNIRPLSEGEPLLISAGIWTKVLAPVWARFGGIAIDLGSALDFLASEPSRPTVLATRYQNAKTVPAFLSLEKQLERTERLEDYLCGRLA